jgi:quercetin dioxygenase-like cupin family protein
MRVPASPALRRDRRMCIVKYHQTLHKGARGMAEEQALGPIGTEVIFENETVRVWLVDLAEGESQALHRHDLHYLVVPLTEGRNEMRFLSGRVVHTNETPGMALWREPGEPHSLINTTGARYRNVLVEFKAVVTPA